MFDIKIVCKDKDYFWYDNVKSFTTYNEDILVIQWWSVGSQRYLYTTFNIKDIKKIKIKNKG